MPICGCCCCWSNEFGALGFSNEKSLVYCVITVRLGAAPGVAPSPFVVVIVVSARRATPVEGSVAWLTQAIGRDKDGWELGVRSFDQADAPAPSGSRKAAIVTHRFGAFAVAAVGWEACATPWARGPRHRLYCPAPWRQVRAASLPASSAEMPGPSRKRRAGR